MNDCQRLIREFCELTRLGDPESIAGGAPLDVGGVTCSITQARHDQANGLVLYCEFGTVPAGRENAIYAELLAQNFLGAPEGGAMFGFSPVAKHVICIQHLRVADVNAERLADILHHLAEKAGEWRQTYFLKPTEGGPAERPASTSGARALLAAGRSPGLPKEIR